MTGIDTIVGEPVVQAVGWALLHFVWQGTLIAAIAAAALRALRHSAADVRYVVAAIALSLMATMPLVTGVQTWRLLTAERPADAGSVIVDAAGGALAPAIATAVEPAGAPLTPVPAAEAAQTIDRWIPWFVAAWMAGVLLLAVRLAGGWLAIQRLRSRHAVPADDRLQALVRRLTRSLHISRGVRLGT